MSSMFCRNCGSENYHMIGESCEDGLGLHWDEYWCPDCDQPCPEDMWVEAGSHSARFNAEEGRGWEVRNV